VSMEETVGTGPLEDLSGRGGRTVDAEGFLWRTLGDAEGDLEGLLVDVDGRGDPLGRACATSGELGGLEPVLFRRRSKAIS